MCVAIYQPKGTAVPDTVLAASVKRNDDGWGILFWDDAGIPHTIQSMDNEQFVPTAAQFAGQEALFHCRIGTAGTKDVTNTHPFVLHPFGDTTMPAYYLMHNGILSIDVYPSDPHSDTYYFARLLEKSGDFTKLLADKDWVSTMEDLIGHNKIIVAGPNHEIYFLNRHLGSWRDGIWYSNTLSLPAPKVSVVKTYDYKNDKTCVATSSTPVTQEDDALAAWGAEAVWVEQTDPESGVRTQRLAGWKLDDGTFIPAGDQTSTASCEVVGKVDTTDLKDDENTEWEFGNHPLEMLASWFEEVKDAGENLDKIEDAEALIEFDVRSAPTDAVAHAILLLMRRNIEAQKKEEERAIKTLIVGENKVSEPQEEPARKLTRAERRAQRRNRHMFPVLST